MKNLFSQIFFVSLFIFIFYSCSNDKVGNNTGDSTKSIKYPIMYKNDKPMDERIHTIKLSKKFEIKRKDNASLYVLCADKSNNFYATHWLTDTNGGDEIFIYDNKGHVKKSFGSKGQGPGEFKNAGRMSCVNDTIVLYDNNLCRVTKFNKDGIYQSMIKTTTTGAFYLVDSVCAYSDLKNSTNNTNYCFESLIGLKNIKTFHDSVIWRNKYCSDSPAFTIFDNLEPSIAIDSENSLIYIGKLSVDEYKVDVFDFKGIKRSIINKHYKKINNNSDEIKEIKDQMGTYIKDLKSRYMRSFNKLYVDKKGRLLVNANAFRTKYNKKNYYIDVFENGKYLFRTILPEIEQHIFDYNQINFINDRLYISKAGEKPDDPNVLTCYEYEIE